MSVPPNLRVMHIGRKIQRMRELRGMKQETMAGKLGLTQQAVSYIEQSDTIEDEKLERIAEALEVTAKDILNLSDETVFTNNVYGEKNTLSQVYSQPISEIHVYNQINPIERIVELYERMLKEKDDVIEMLKKNQKAS